VNSLESKAVSEMNKRRIRGLMKCNQRYD
jgi:hypothetical protein